MLGIIGGSGLTSLPNLTVRRREVVRTPYGDPSSALMFGSVGGCEAVFLARHGQGHTLPPHRVNYRANLWAFHAREVRQVVGVFSVGGIAAGLAPGTVCIPHQLIDYTYGREGTFFDGLDQRVVHVDFTRPYTARLRAACLEAAAAAGVPAVDGGVYAVVNGPRLETAAEIDRLERDGATMVGMTGMPEASLARELGVDYAAIAVAVNWAAGRGDSAEAISLDQLKAVLGPAMERVHRLIEALVARCAGGAS